MLEWNLKENPVLDADHSPRCIHFSYSFAKPMEELNRNTPSDSLPQTTGVLIENTAPSETSVLCYDNYDYPLKRLVAGSCAILLRDGSYKIKTLVNEDPSQHGPAHYLATSRP